MPAKSALIIVDAQNDFVCPGRPLACKNGLQTIENINYLLKATHKFALVVKSRDWHPPDHCSFQVWPPHCIQNTEGAQLHPNLIPVPGEIIVDKGQLVESYSAFRSDIELAKLLLQLEIRQVYVTGFVREVCVSATAVDSRDFGFETAIVSDCCGEIGLPIPQKEDEIRIISSKDIIQKH